eukprot:TRINITY_DN10186_c0_g1_i1.p1 TRINITY_DN10186_c0_g1~~TRINITY_DN10186_c0_g1_i1.p1  ORF type:complete len:232 (+),score=23.17 TRINITY_DN10186_c0_g1_i1:94-789(+)
MRLCGHSCLAGRPQAQQLCAALSVLLFSLPCAVYFAYMVSRSSQEYNINNDRGCQNITADLEAFWDDIPTATGLYRRNVSLRANEWICYVISPIFVLDERFVYNTTDGVDHYLSVSTGRPLPAYQQQPSARSAFSCSKELIFMNVSNSNDTVAANVSITIDVGKLSEAWCDIAGFGSSVNWFYRIMFILIIVALILFAVVPSLFYAIAWIVKYVRYVPPIPPNPPPSSGGV